MSKWISVKDRLPDACERVITIQSHGYQAVCQYVPMKKEFFECGIKQKVTHWQPLLELPPVADEPIIIQDEPFHAWFGLTYASYLVLPRIVLQSMPRRWQLKMIALINRIPKTLEIEHEMPDYQVLAKENGKFVKDHYREYRRAPNIRMIKNDAK